MNIKKYLELHSREVVTCGPDEPAQKIAALLTEKRTCALPVVDAEGNMVGIVSERDLVDALGEKGGAIDGLRARDMMTKSVISCTPDDTMARVRQVMLDKGFRNVPVLDGKKLTGVIGVRDALKTRINEKELEVNVLKDTVIAARNG